MDKIIKFYNMFNKYDFISFFLLNYIKINPLFYRDRANVVALKDTCKDVLDDFEAFTIKYQ